MSTLIQWAQSVLAMGFLLGVSVVLHVYWIYCGLHILAAEGAELTDEELEPMRVWKPSKPRIGLS